MKALAPFLLGLALLWPTLSAAAPQKVTVQYQALEGTPALRQELDIYPATTKAKNGHPVVVWVHGGAWRIGSKEHSVALKANTLTKDGYLLVAINYRFHPDANYQDQANDVAHAVKWVQDNIAKHGGDPTRISLMGHSAGAHLAALTSLDPRYFKQAKVDPSAIKSVILLDGAGYDIPLHLEVAGRRAAKLYTTIFSDDPATQKAASPITYAKKRKHLPAFLIIPVASRDETVTQSNNLATALSKAGGMAKVHVAPGKTHLTLNREWGKKEDAPTEVSLEFLAKTLAK